VYNFVKFRNANKLEGVVIRPMKNGEYYEKYPLWIILLSNLVSLGIYGIGAYVMYWVGWIWLVLYILYIAFLEIKLLRKSCTNCYYYGKNCAFGKGKLCSLFFRKGHPEEFVKRQITWKDILPDFLVTVIPVVAGIVLLILDFEWLLLILLLVLLLLTFTGNGFIRGSLACRYCRQCEIGCPAARLFSK
jgi:hypothetical protein